jgi:branched-chain amino acid transport system permease protein
VLTILFDGVAYGMLLFVLSVGLCVTLGLMNFINLAHGAFAMAGGYLTVVMMNWYGIRIHRQRGSRRRPRTHALFAPL